MQSSTALADLAARFWAFQCEESPTTAIAAGVPIDADQLLREAPTDSERRAAWARAAQTELAAIDPAPLGLQDRATRRLLDYEFRLLAEMVDSGAHLRPTLYPLGPEFTLIYWANSTALATAADARRYLKRLAATPSSFASVQESLAQGVRAGMAYPRLVVERAIAQVRGQMSMAIEENAFFGPLGRIASRGGTMAALAEEGRALVEEVVKPTFLAYADYLETTVLLAARDSLACTDDVKGERLYAYYIGQYTTLDTSPVDIHNIGLAEVERIKREMLVVAGEAGFLNDIEGFRRHLQTDDQQFAPSAEALREQIEVLSKRIDARIPEFFGRTPRTTYGVSTIPLAIADKMPPAYAQPNPADGSAAGVNWITSIPGKCPRYMHLPLALHEAWPGHLMHLALIQEMDQLPDFRRFGALKYTACLEGWALYCEALGADMGFYNTPEKLYGRLEMEMWRAVRLVLDTGIHANGWSRDQAIAFFRNNMAMPLETLTAEVDRYIGMPGQALAYQLGNLRFRALRARAEAALGEHFRIRDFHDALMAAGAVTLPVLELLIDDWIANTKAVAAVAAYPIGQPGRPWGERERGQWRARQSRRRSYEQDVVPRVRALSGRFEKIAYGQLEYENDVFTLYALRTHSMGASLPTALVTGGVHGYETSGVSGALEFLEQHAEAYAGKIDLLVIPCVSPWAYERINRWNYHAVDPNRNFRAGGPALESTALMELVRSVSNRYLLHIDLHETTDSDESEFRPALSARDGKDFTPGEIPHGFYLVADEENPQLNFQRAIISAVQKVTGIASPDTKGEIIGSPVIERGVIAYPLSDLALCASITKAPFTTTTEVYPDADNITPDECIRAQVTAICAALDFALEERRS